MQYMLSCKDRRSLSAAEKALNAEMSGIYQIRCLATGDLYVGATKTLRFRYTSHLASLEGGYHSNPLLKAAYAKYGADNFVFELLEDLGVLNLDDSALTNLLVEREKYWTEKLNPAYCQRRSRYFHRGSKDSYQKQNYRDEVIDGVLCCVDTEGKIMWKYKRAMA